jgi:molecular chaperone DnaJ
MLGVEPDVSPAEIKRAYRKLVKTMHPDIGHSDHSAEDRNHANERMMRINEAYETLMDGSKRAAYDDRLGLYRSRRVVAFTSSMADEDLARERYLRVVFHPARHAVTRVLSLYARQQRQLSLDIYDDELVAAFEHYVDSFEAALRQASDSFAREAWPRSLDAAVQMMRHCIAQSADALDEMRNFCLNFDYDHLSMAQNLVKIAQELSRQSLRLTKYS